MCPSCRSADSVCTRLIRGAIVFFVLLTCLRIWLGPSAFEAQAEAQIPDSGLQRKQQLEEARITNQRLAEIITILERGTLNVRLEGADNQAPAPARTRSTDK